MKLFDIIGPVMIGPSSSHTAGAVKIGLVARKLLGEKPVKANIKLHGSFAMTGAGHGTDRAIVAGLLGIRPDDERIPESFDIARQEGLSFDIDTTHIPNAHPKASMGASWKSSLPRWAGAVFWCPASTASLQISRVTKTP